VLSEEVYFRGWLQPVLAERWGAVAAVSLSALAFAALHILGGARSPITLVNLFFGGLLFGALAHYRQGLAGAVAAHFAWNWTEQMVLGLDPNPGLGSFGAFYNLELAGSPYWGGSEEGLNASLAMTITLAALLVPVLLLIRSRKPVPIRTVPTG
jgi:membrane protease YdiL (CAAX protease family)